MTIRRVPPSDLALMRGLLEMFGEVFEDTAYSDRPPGDEHLRRLLARETSSRLRRSTAVA
jgi:hypothetical protein